MVTQQAVALYVVLKGVDRPLRPEVALRGQSKFDIRRYTQNTANGEIELDDSRMITRTVYTLREDRPYRYGSLARDQPLVKAGKVSLDDMRETLGKFYDDFERYRYIVWAELMDSHPQLRGFELPIGMNAFLYRGLWTVKGDYDIDVSAIDPEKDLVAVDVPSKYARRDYVPVPREYAPMDQSWKDVTGVIDGLCDHYIGDLDFAKKNLKGLNALRWGFWHSARPYLFSYGRPDDRDSGRGALLGSRLSADEIVEGFVAPEPQQPKLSAYEIELRQMEGDF